MPATNKQIQHSKAMMPMTIAIVLDLFSVIFSSEIYKRLTDDTLDY